VFSEVIIVFHLLRSFRERLAGARERPEAGYSTEAVVVIALLVAVAVAAVGIIGAKVLAKAHGIDTGP
jgi:hypothetical protein